MTARSGTCNDQIFCRNKVSIETKPITICDHITVITAIAINQKLKQNYEGDKGKSQEPHERKMKTFLKISISVSPKTEIESLYSVCK